MARMEKPYYETDIGKLEDKLAHRFFAVRSQAELPAGDRESVFNAFVQAGPRACTLFLKQHMALLTHDLKKDPENNDVIYDKTRNTPFAAPAICHNNTLVVLGTLTNDMKKLGLESPEKARQFTLIRVLTEMVVSHHYSGFNAWNYNGFLNALRTIDLEKISSEPLKSLLPDTIENSWVRDTNTKKLEAAFSSLYAFYCVEGKPQDMLEQLTPLKPLFSMVYDNNGKIAWEHALKVPVSPVNFAKIRTSLGNIIVAEIKNENTQQLHIRTQGGGRSNEDRPYTNYCGR